MASKLHEQSGKGGPMAGVHGGAQQGRRKGIGTRVWQVVSESGESRLEEVGKYSIMRRTGLPARDLRILDPMLSYPSTILGRERAIVANLEHIKAIITAKELLMINSTNPLVVHFLHDLQRRISSPRDRDAPQPQSHQTMKSIDPEAEDAADDPWGSPSRGSHIISQNINSSPDMQHTEKGIPHSTAGTPITASPKLLPFEFRALEACLESACRCLESETRTLEQEAYPALDELTSKISTLNLERVRQIKSRLVAISGRVQKVRDELEYLLDDDNDMAEMYLTEKLEGHSTEETSLREGLLDVTFEDNEERVEDSESQHSSETFTGLKPDIKELEMLLEAYFAQIDGISQKLFHMSEYVDDTEDYINIMLDEKQNQLLQMGVMLSTANMILNAGIGVVGIFGMNITIELFSGQPIQFWETVMGTVGGCVAMYWIAIAWGKKKSLL
ncbi:hypothetical protein NMG60_11033061 [Bertholletia excelsa]